VDPGTATRAGLKELLGRGWCEYEFDSAARNGNVKAAHPPSSPPNGNSAELVN